MITLLENRCLVTIKGKDRASFLNSLLSSNISALTPEKAQISLFLTPQGKFLNDLIIFTDGDTIFIDVEKNSAAFFMNKLRAFKLRSDVDIAESDLAVYAESAEKSYSNTMRILDPRSQFMGHRLYGTEISGKSETAYNYYEQKRIKLGIPDGSRDIPYERGIPLEYGFDEMGAIDWEKGCYLGQELTARTKHRNLIKKRLLPFSAINCIKPIETGQPIFRNDKEIGEVRSVNHNIGLAHIRLTHFYTNEGYNFESFTCEGGQFKIEVPNWMQLPKLES